MLYLPPIFTDGAIFQRGREIRVYGDGSGEFCARFRGMERRCTARDGFEVTFPACEAGGPYEMELTLNGETRLLRDLWVGDVLLISGQSNAEVPICETFDEGTAFDSDPLVRFYLPMAIVQLNDHPDPSSPLTTAIQNAQAEAAARIPDCRLVTIRDLGDHDRIHPRNKRDVAERIMDALAEMWAE